MSYLSLSPFRSSRILLSYRNDPITKLNGAYALNVLKSNIFNTCPVNTTTSSSSLSFTKKSIKLGHGGTLDPLATGVLVIGVGSGTKALQQYLGCTKEYVVTGKLGSSTTTYDSEGTVDNIAPYDHITQSSIQTILSQFTGTILQRPPIYSAIKRKGMRLCDIARQYNKQNNVTMELSSLSLPDPRPITIYSIILLQFTSSLSSPPQFTLQVNCSKGTYIRSLVHDIGIALNSRAHVTQLRRTCQGDWSLSNSLPQEQWCYSNVINNLRFTNDNGEFTN